MDVPLVRTPCAPYFEGDGLHLKGPVLQAFCAATHLLMNREIHYLNTDLDLESPFDLGALARALSSQGVFALTVDQRENATWFATFESDEVFPAPEQNIAAFLNAIEALDSESLKLWAVCTLREFNIGYDCGDKPWAFNNGLAANTLARMAALGIGLRVTIYPAVSEETDH